MHQKQNKKWATKASSGYKENGFKNQFTLNAVWMKTPKSAAWECVQVSALQCPGRPMGVSPKPTDSLKAGVN